MAASSLVDLVKIYATNQGTGALTLGEAVQGYRGVEALLNGATYSYSIQQDAQWEIGKATYLAVDSRLVRTPTDSSNGGGAVDFQANAAVAFVALSEDILARDVLQPLYGFGPPLPGQGLIGQTYTDLTRPVTLYGPKTASGWGTGVTLQGSPGTAASYETLEELQAADPASLFYVLLNDFGGTNYALVSGDFRERIDNLNVIALNAVPPQTAALVRQASSNINYDGRNVEQKIAEIPSVADTRFAGGARGDVTTNNVNALTDALRPANAGYKTIPAGIYSSATVTQTLAPGAPHHLDGDGPGVSVIRKLTNDAAIALDLAGTPQNLDNHTVISNLSFDNGFRGLNGTGLRLTNTAREVVQNVVFDGLSAGFYARGALLLTNVAVTFRNCNKGFSQERGPGFSSGSGTAYVYPNMNKFIGGTALGCPGTGFDINHASGFGLVGTNVESCGTSGDLTTGGLLIRPQIAVETGFGTMEISGHFERNSGFGGITGGPLTGLILHIRDSDFVANEAARDIDVSGAWSIGLTSNQGNGVTKIQARMSYVMGGLYNTLIDTSPNFFHHTETADGPRVMWMSEFRLCHDPAVPLNADLQFLRGDQVTGSAADKDISYIYKRGASQVRFSAGNAVKISYSTAGIGFNGNNPIAPGQIANPTDAASTQASLTALLNFLRNRGDLMP